MTRTLATAIPLLLLGGLVALAGAGSADTISWDTAADWDASADSQDVVHDTIGDRTDAGQTRIGYPASDQGGSSLEHYWALDADNGSGNSYTDHAGSADVDCTSVSATVGVFDTNAFLAGGSSCDAANGEVLDDDFTVSAWVLDDGTNSNFEIVYINGDSGGSPVSPALLGVDNAGRIRFQVEADDGTTCQALDATLPQTLTHLVGRFDNGACDLFVNGVLAASDTSIGLSSGTSQEHSIGGDANSNVWSGRIDEVRVYNRTLTETEIRKAADTTGLLNTSTKTFSFAAKPDLVNVTSGEVAGDTDAANVTVVGSPGTASEETNTVTLDGSSSYTLTWVDTHTDFRLETNFTVDDVTTTPTLSSAGLQANDTGGTNNPPTAAFTSDCAGLGCTFNGSDSSDSDGSISSWDWEFGDGSTGSGEVVSHTYSAPGTFQVNLTVTDNEGATDTTSQNVTVENGDTTQTSAQVWDVDEDLLDDEPARLCINTTINLTGAPDEVWVSYEDSYPSGNTSARSTTTRLLMDSDRCVALDNRPNGNTFLWANISNATGTRLDGFWHVGDTPEEARVAGDPFTIAGHDDEAILQVAAWGLLLFVFLKFGLTFAGIATLPGILDPLIAGGTRFGFVFTVVLVVIALFIEYGVRNTFWPAKEDDGQDPFRT